VNPPEFERAIEELTHHLALHPSVRAAILYGSAARGTATRESDVDLLILTPRSEEDRLMPGIHDIESAMDVTISPYFVEEEELLKVDRQFLDSIIREGRALVGAVPKVAVQDLDLRPFRAVSLFVSHLQPPMKMRLYRRLDGYTTVRRRGRKRYERQVQGFLDRVGGWRIGRGAIMVPERAVPELEAILEDLGAKRSLVPIWIQAP